MPELDEEAPKAAKADEATALLPQLGSCSDAQSWRKARASSEALRFASIALASVILISIGVVMGMKLEGWKFVTALYFVVQVVTTIGYGDFTPTHDLTKVFCAFYILCSLVVLAYAINLIAQQLAKLHTNFIRKRLRVLEAVVFRHATPEAWRDASEWEKLHGKMREKYGHFNKLIAATVVVVLLVVCGTIFYATYEACSCSYGKTKVPGCRMDSHEACVRTGGYVLTWSSAFYMSVVTLTTVGFGDHTPKSHLGRSVSIFWMLVGVGAMANWVAKLTEFFIQEQLSREDLLREEINDETFAAMDLDGDGNLSLSEYRSYILVRHGLVSQMDLDIIDSHYTAIDRNGDGRITLAMIKQAQISSPKVGGTP